MFIFFYLKGEEKKRTGKMGLWKLCQAVGKCFTSGSSYPIKKKIMRKNLGGYNDGMVKIKVVAGVR